MFIKKFSVREKHAYICGYKSGIMYNKVEDKLERVKYIFLSRFITRNIDNKLKQDQYVSFNLEYRNKL